MENNASLYRTEYCPILSVTAFPGVNDYPPFDLFCNVSTGDKELFEKSLYEGKRIDSDDCWQLNALVTLVCTEKVSQAVHGGDKEFETACDVLAKIIRLYGSKLLSKKKLIGEWLCDMCLVSGRTDQIPKLASKVKDIPFASDYAVGSFIYGLFSGENEFCTDEIYTLLNGISAYDIASSDHFAQNKELYDKILCAVIPKMFGAILCDNGKDFLVPPICKVTRTAFMGLPCPNCECGHIQVEYIPYSDNTALSDTVSAFLRHIENLIRQGLGAKSKLVGFTLSPEYRKLAADTIREVMPEFLPAPAKVGRKPKEKTIRAVKSVRVEGDKTVMEPIDLNIDLSKAKRLEAESWKLAEMLGADYGGSEINFNVGELYGESEENTSSETEAEKNVTVENTATDIPEEWQEFYLLLEETEKRILCLISNGSDPTEYARRKGGMIQGYADSINEKASDAYGDIILETGGASIEFIEDYKQELADIFRDIYNTEVL